MNFKNKLTLFLDLRKLVVKMSVSPTPLSSSESPRRNIFSQNINPEVRKIRSLLNKATDETLEGLINHIIKIVVLEKHEDFEFGKDSLVAQEDKKQMIPIIQTFIANICHGKEDSDAIRIYTAVFCNMVNRWPGRQGIVLLRCMVNELNTFFNDYRSKTHDDDERRKCFCIVRYFCECYNFNKVIPARMILATQNSFIGPEENKVEVFHRFVKYTDSSIKTDELYSKLKVKFSDYMKDCITRKDFSSMKLVFDSEIALKSIQA